MHAQRPTETLHVSDIDEALTRRQRRRTRRRRVTITIASVLTGALVLTGAGIALAYKNFNDNISRSDFSLPLVDDVLDDSGEQNILIMGMDSRLDQNGDPLPAEVYDAIRAGDESDGGYNANVLMLLHVPEDRSKAVGISIPRDDYVEIVGAPLGVENSKIKEAYGLALQQRMNDLYEEESELSEDEIYQEARAAGRQAQIETVSHFLGDVRIDHFVEMTMGGFYHVAQAVQPLTVCLNEATVDTYSGADFAAGVQEIDAEQAMSFVRQRRDTSEDGPFLTDLDRSRRQQAFMISLVDKINTQSTFTSPKKISALMDATTTHVALDTNFDVLKFVKMAREVSKTGVEFVTLPILEFDMIDGAYVNTVDQEEIQQIVAAIFAGTYFDGSYLADASTDADDADATTTDETAEDAGAPTPVDPPASPAEQKTNETGLPVYDSWDDPIRAGAIPCVN
ncbi:LCP family protein [Leucobacter sp. cx-42]|uniref:LCP family protein n=1 Tax=unclassified Leucobacter TaxID=2621730 RepID=UPI00165DF102|nr:MULTISPECIES: LCP family protein [unclassified Leucobacter]MBC9954279.1 LCP family protein [Leucobacter sp. cx-42]